MAVPDFQSSCAAAEVDRGGEEHSLAEAVERLGQEFHLTDEDRGSSSGVGRRASTTASHGRRPISGSQACCRPLAKGASGSPIAD